jgi:hypothetical protein
MSDSTPTDGTDRTLDLPPQIVLQSADGTEQAVATHATTISRAQILATGADCTLTVLAAFPLGQNDSTGQPATGLILSAEAPGKPAWQAQIGIAIPAADVPTVVVGAKLPGKYLTGTGQADDDNLVAPVWS